MADKKPTDHIGGKGDRHQADKQHRPEGQQKDRENTKTEADNAAHDAEPQK